MAQRVNIVLEDDIDGSAADETVTFGLDGTSYEIDLNSKNAQALRDALSSYIGHARRVGSSRSGSRTSGNGSRRSRSSSRGSSRAAEIREWARSNGYEVSERGRVSSEIVEAFDAAN